MILTCWGKLSYQWDSSELLYVVLVGSQSAFSSWKFVASDISGSGEISCSWTDTLACVLLWALGRFGPSVSGLKSGAFI